ncbi:hypothetical protein ACFL5O_10165 [Myxococcota bacterium]
MHWKLASEENSRAPTTVGIVTWAIDGATELLDAYIEFGINETYATRARVVGSASWPLQADSLPDPTLTGAQSG